MDRNFLGVEWLQSQIQVINPILVMILIPVFQFVLYPAIDRVFKLTSIRKMAIGFFLTSASFWLVTRGQALIDSGSTPSIAWQLWAYLLLTSGEIMISITGLEFSYTQAPRTMKSVVMAVWLLSVSLGNIFTSTVNHSIQTPGIGQVTAEAASAKIDTPLTAGTWKYSVSDRRSADDSQKGRTIRVFGADNTADTADDVTIDLDEYDVVTSITTIDNDVLEQAAQLVDDRFFQSANDDADKSLPNTEAGQLLLQDLRDSQGLPLVYKQVTRNQYRITTAGGDSTHQTQWDIVLTGQVTRVDQNKTDSPEQAPLTWLEKRIIEIKGERGREEVQRARGNIASTEVGHDITVGGQDTLEGADYFEFWTITTLITAVLFIPVGYLYKEKSYIQSTDDESADESLSGQAGTTSHEESGNDSDPEF
jgi:POT family proton-dependent oligopeptide transporter